jgi:microcystin-dependent protein
MPTHNHVVASVSSTGNKNLPTGNLPANTKTLDKEYSNQSATVTMNPQLIGTAGGNQPVNIMPPYSVVSFIIAIQGIFPSRN